MRPFLRTPYERLDVLDRTATFCKDSLTSGSRAMSSHVSSIVAASSVSLGLAFTKLRRLTWIYNHRQELRFKLHRVRVTFNVFHCLPNFFG
jgi:hypothetical protein